MHHPVPADRYSCTLLTVNLGKKNFLAVRINPTAARFSFRVKEEEVGGGGEGAAKRDPTLTKENFLSAAADIAESGIT